MNKKIIISVAILIGLSFVGFLILSNRTEDKITINPGASSPTPTNNQNGDSIENEVFGLSFTDHSGNNVPISDFEGKTLIINSWATWCPFCIDELPDFVTAQKEFGDEIIIIAINRRESTDEAEKYINSLNITDNLVYLLDPSDSFYKTIGGFGMPETLFINKKGEAVIHKRGPMDLHEIRDKIEQTL